MAILVFSLFVAPGEAQAHGLHSLSGVSAPVTATDGATTEDALGGSEVSASNCGICCASSGCVAVSVLETFDPFDAGGAKGGFQAASTVAVYQMAQYGLRRPPRQNF